MSIFPPFSQPQEVCLPVKTTNKPKRQQTADDGDDHVARSFGQMLIEKQPNVAARQTRCQPPKATADNVAGEIDGNRVHADPNERLAPRPPLPNIDNQIE